MGDMGDMWKEAKPVMKEASRKKRASNRRQGASELFVRGVPVEKKNGGAHLIVLPNTEQRVDYWPGTGLWHAKDGQKGRGIQSLLKKINAGPEVM